MLLLTTAHLATLNAVLCFSLLCGCSSRRTVSVMVQPAVWWTWSWTTQMTGTTTLLSSTSRANEASTPLGPARTQKPDSTVSVTLAGNESYFCLLKQEEDHIQLVWSNRNLILSKSSKEGKLRETNNIKIIFYCFPEYWGCVCCRMNSVQSR